MEGAVGRLTSLRRLRLPSAELTDNDTALRCLRLMGSPVSDGGLEAALAALLALRKLELSICCELAGTGLGGLRACPAVFELGLHACDGLTVPGLCFALGG